MKYFIILLLLLSNSAISQDSFSIIDKYRLHRHNKYLDDHTLNKNSFDKSFEIRFIEDIVETMPTSTYHLLLYKFSQLAVSENFIDLETSMKRFYGDSIQLQNLLNYVDELNEYYELLSHTDRKKIAKMTRRYHKLKPKINYWQSVIYDSLNALKAGNIHISLQEENEKLRDSLKKERNINLLIDEYNSKDLLIDFINSFSNEVQVEIEKRLENGAHGQFLIRAERFGENGESLSISISPNFEENYKYYSKGVYQSDQVNEIFKVFAAKLIRVIPDSSIIKGTVIGEADAYPIPKNSNVKYSDFSDIWGIIRDTIYKPFSTITLYPQQSLTNFDLAFLRAYNVKFIMEKYLQQDCVNKIIVIDHGKIDINKKDEVGTYRNASVKIFVYNFFRTGNDEIFRPENIIKIKNNLDQEAERTYNTNNQ